MVNSTEEPTTPGNQSVQFWQNFVKLDLAYSLLRAPLWFQCILDTVLVVLTPNSTYGSRMCVLTCRSQMQAEITSFEVHLEDTCSGNHAVRSACRASACVLPLRVWGLRRSGCGVALEGFLSLSYTYTHIYIYVHV